MPNYTYVCVTHGLFDLLRPMKEYNEKGECPECKALCEKIIVAPHINIPLQHQACPKVKGKSREWIEKNYRGSAADPNYGKKKK